MLTDWPKMLKSVFGSINFHDCGTENVSNSWKHASFLGIRADFLWNPNNNENMTEYSLEEVVEHCHYDDCWIVIYDKVYDVTNFIHEHPGGDYIIRENSGRDSTLAFLSSGHNKEAIDLLKKYCIGRLIKSQRIYS